MVVRRLQIEGGGFFSRGGSAASDHFRFLISVSSPVGFYMIGSLCVPISHFTRQAPREAHIKMLCAASTIPNSSFLTPNFILRCFSSRCMMKEYSNKGGTYGTIC